MIRFVFRLIWIALIALVLAVAAFWLAAQWREAGAGATPEGGRFIATAEGRIHVIEAGPEDGVPLLFAHGTAAWAGLWRPTLAAVGAEGYRAMAFDMPPFGFSDAPRDGDVSRERQAERVIALLEALPQRPIVVAHSIGAGPVSEAILRRPDLVAGYVVVAGAVALGSHQAPRGVPVYLRAGWLREGIAAATTSNPWLTGPFLRGFLHVKDAATPEVIAVLQEPMQRPGYTRAVAGWLPQLFVTPQDARSTRMEAWQALNVPSALIWGDKDTVTPPVQGRALEALIPGAVYRELEGVGHIPQIEAPEAFRKILLEELARIAVR